MEVGLTSVMLGAGRKRTADSVDATAGIILKKKVGDRVEVVDEIASFYSSQDVEGLMEAAAQRIVDAYTIKVLGDEKGDYDVPPLVTHFVSKTGADKFDMSVLDEQS